MSFILSLVMVFMSSVKMIYLIGETEIFPLMRFYKLVKKDDKRKDDPFWIL